MTDQTLTVAICTYNRADRLPGLVHALRAQTCPIPFAILFVDNNSPDNTREVLAGLAQEPGAPLRFVTETQQGIPYARNRALAECMDRDYLLFMDDDEMPRPGLLAAAVDALGEEGAECAGGRVEVVFAPGQRPRWLGDDLLGFLAAVDHGAEKFWITDDSTPVWTANVAYRMALFAEDPELRFDIRYNRLGQAIGGGSDAIMFKAMLERGVRMRYRPDMAVEHYVEAWRLRRSYFLRLHFIAGRKFGEYQMGARYPREALGVAPFMVGQAATATLRALRLWMTANRQTVRQGMNAAYACGIILGRFRRWKHGA